MNLSIISRSYFWTLCEIRNTHTKTWQPTIFRVKAIKYSLIVCIHRELWANIIVVSMVLFWEWVIMELIVIYTFEDAKKVKTIFWQKQSPSFLYFSLLNEKVFFYKFMNFEGCQQFRYIVYELLIKEMFSWTFSWK